METPMRHHPVPLTRLSAAALLGAALAVAFVAPAPVLADDPVAAKHGGSVISFPFTKARLEGVQDTRSGTVTLHGLPVEGAMTPNDIDPVLVLSDGTEIRIPRL
jgi:hypothetical protein